MVEIQVNGRVGIDRYHLLTFRFSRLKANLIF